jgi:hypothetical protein
MIILKEMATMMNVRRSIVGLLLATVSLGIATPVQAETWVEYNTNQAFRFFVDRESVKKQGQIVWLSAYLLFDQPVGNGSVQVGSLKYYMSLDCRARAVRIRQLVAYDANKNYLSDRDPGDRGPLFRASNDPLTQQLFGNLCRR